MSYKPTNEDLVAYLYGELEESTRAQIDQYFKENPEARAELEEMEETRVALNQWEDEEVPVMPGFIQPHENSEWLYWRKYVAIAATVLLVLTFGWVSGFNLSYDEEGLQLGFGGSEDGISLDEVSKLLADQEQDLIFRMNNGFIQVKDSLGNEMKTIEASLDKVANTAPISDRQINDLLNERKGELLADMNKLSDQMTEDYREIFRQLVVSFSNNYETQRIQDLRNVQTAFNDLEDAMTSKQEALEEALYNLSIEVDALASNNNNNND